MTFDSRQGMPLAVIRTLRIPAESRDRFRFFTIQRGIILYLLFFHRDCHICRAEPNVSPAPCRPRI